MKKNISKKMLALICALSVALTSISFPFSSKADVESATCFADSGYADWEQVTFSDFDIQDDTYNEIQDADAITLGTYGGTLEGKVFNGNVTFSSATTLAWFNGIYLACEDYTNAATGTNDLYMSVDGTTYQLTTENTGTTSLLDTELNLKLSYEVVTKADESKYLKLGVWINDRLYNNEYIEIATYDSYLNGGVAYQTPVEGAYLTIESVMSETYFEDSDYADWEQVTFSDFDIQDDTYNEIQDADAITLGTYGGTLEGKVFNGNVTFSSATTLAWFNGIYLACEDYTNAATGTNDLYMSVDGTTYQLTTENTGTTSLLDTELNLKLSYEVVTKADESKYLKLGVWINDRLYNNEYIEIATYDAYLNGGVAYQTPVEGAYLTLKSVTTETYFADTDYADWEQITFSNFGLDGTYNEVNSENLSVVGQYDGSLAGKVFSGNVTFSEFTNHLIIGGANDPWDGVYLISGYTEDMTVLHLLANGEHVIPPKVAGKDQATLVGTEFNLKLSYDVVESSGTKYLKLGVWIEDTLYKYIDITNYESCIGGYMGIYTPMEGSSVMVQSVKEETAVDFADTQYKDWEQITFKDFDIDDDTYTGTSDDGFGKKGCFSGGTLVGKVFNGDVTISEIPSYLIIGGANDFWDGTYLISNLDGSLEVLGQGTISSKIAVPGEQFNLKLSYDEVESDGAKYLKLGVWINNKLHNNQYITHTSYESVTGPFMSFYTEGEGAYVTVASIKPEKPEEQIKFTDTEYTNWEQVTFEDFGIADDTYSGTSDDGFGKIGYFPGGTLAGKVFNGDVTISEIPSYLIIGGADDIWNGTYLISNSSGSLEVLGHGNVSSKDAVPGQKFNLKLSYDVVESDGTKYLKLGVWINDKLLGNKYITRTDYESCIGPFMGLYTEGEGAYVTVASVIREMSEEQVKFADTKYNNWEQITFNDFGIEDGTYGGAESYKNGYYGGASLAGKVFSGNVKFSDVRSDIWIGGQDDMWNGIGLLSGYMGDSQNLYLLAGGQTYKFSSKIVDTTLTKNEFNLKLSYDIVGNGDSKFLKLGVWFDDKLYNNEYIEIATWKDSSGKTHTYEEYIGTYLGIYTEVEESYVKVSSIGTKTLSSKLKRLTFRDFGIQDGTYTYIGDVAVSGTYAGTLAGVVICGDVTFSSKPATLFVGGKSDVKQGLSITSGVDGNLILKIGNDTYTLTPDVAGTKLVGKSINLQLSYQVDNNTLEFGVWINGKLYDNKYIYVSDNHAEYLIGQLAVYPESEGSSLKLVSEKIEVLDPLLEKISFADYSISDGTYSGEDKMEVGYYMGGYDGKVFSGNVTFSDSSTYIIIGGVDDPWNGIYLMSGYEGDTTTLRLMVEGREYMFTPEIAGTTLVGEMVNLKLSYQLVDSDNDGKKDVLKLGVWFNNKLYNNQYIYVKDYEKYMGPFMGIYTAWKDSNIIIASDLSIDNPALGSRRAPAPNTGDAADTVLYIGLAVFAIVAIVVLGKKQRLE